jgi:hypothetical protein
LGDGMGGGIGEGMVKRREIRELERRRGLF